MKQIKAVVLAGALVGLAGCASAPSVVVTEPLGPAPMGVAQGQDEGSLVIYSARTPADVDLNMDEWRANNDYGKNAYLYEPAHTDYTIYSRSGQVLRQIRNARDPNDGTPTIVTLPPGSYRVAAEAVSCDSSRVNVLMTVVIKPGQATIAHLEGGWNPQGQFGQAELAKLPCGRVIGWRAPEAGFASSPPGAHAN